MSFGSACIVIGLGMIQLLPDSRACYAISPRSSHSYGGGPQLVTPAVKSDWSVATDARGRRFAYGGHSLVVRSWRAFSA